MKGDFNADGKSDIAVLYDYGGARTAIWTFNGTATGPSSPVLRWSSVAGGFDANKAKPTVGDFNGDRYSDVAAVYDYGSGVSGIWIWRGSASGLTAAPVLVWQSQPGTWDWARMALIPGDFNGDGRTDLGVQYDYGNAESALWTFAGTATGLAAPVQRWRSVPGGFDAKRSKLVAGDFNGDGKADVGVLYSYDPETAGLWLWRGTGAGLGAAPQLAWKSAAGAWRWGASSVVPGDFDGDRKGDIGLLYDYGGGNAGLWTFRGTATGLSAPTRP